MTVARFLSDYGYAALAVGCFLEGETLLLLAGVAAHRGYLSLPLVVAVAFASGTLGDQLYFLVGRRYGDRLPDVPRFREPIARVRRLVESHADGLIVGVRFMYGLRLVGPVIIGASRVAPLRFAALNMVGAAIWAVAVAGAGYCFSDAVERLIGDLQAFEQIALGCAAAVVLAVAVWNRRRRRRGR